MSMSVGMKTFSGYEALFFVLVLIIAMAVPIGADAEGKPLMTQYYETPTLYNPAAAGSGDLIRIRLGGRLQWTGTEDYPKSFMATADMPLTIAGKSFGIGVNAMNLSEGMSRSLTVNLQAGYGFNIGRGKMSAAVNLGYGRERYKGAPDYEEEASESLPTQQAVKLKGNLVDLGAGLFYSMPNFWVGVSGMHLNAPKATLGEIAVTGGDNPADGTETVEVRLRRTAYLMTGGNIPLGSTLLEVMPSMIVRTDFDRIRGELTGRLRYKKLISVGVGYRLKDAVSATVAAEYKGLFIGYSYDYPTSSLSRCSNGSHELVVGYSFKLDMVPKRKNRYKSIRIM